MALLTSCEKDFEDNQNFKTNGKNTKEADQTLMRKNFTGDSLILQNPY